MRASVLLAVALIAIPAVRAQPAGACVPSSAVQTALDQLPTYAPPETEWQAQQKHLAALRELLARFPDDIFVQRAYIDAMWRRPDKEHVIGEYKARHERNPEDPQANYLYGLTLIGRQSAESIKLFQAALAKVPQFPWPHLALARIYNAPAFLDKSESERHVQAFLAACPESLDGYRQLTSLDDKNLLRASAGKLRALLAPRTDPEGIGAYTTLWSLEFKAHPLSEYEGLRKQVAVDLNRIRALLLENKRQWYEALEEGYKLVNDQRQSDWAREERQQHVPYAWELASMSKWNKDHKYPQRDDPADKKRAYYHEVLKQTELWLKERPGMVYAWGSRLDAMEHLDDVPPAEIEAAADEYFKAAKANAGPEGPDSGDYFTIASVLSKKHLQPERVADMAAESLAKWQTDSQEPYYDLYATKENLSEYNFYQATQPVRAYGFEAGAYIEQKQAGKARVALTEMEDRLENLKKLAGDKADFKKEYTQSLASRWELMAREAELEVRDQDAMAFYENALLSRFESQQKPETGVKDEMAENARRLWTKLGGTNDGWQMWYGRRADALANQATLTWEDANQPLPSFEIADIKGKTWNLASLHGKVTFLNFWASW
jgi:hypothetical protein